MSNNAKNLPEVKLGQYKGLAVTRHVRPLSEKTIDQEMVHQARMRSVYHNSTAPAKRGSRVLLDFVGFMDGEEIPRQPDGKGDGGSGGRQADARRRRCHLRPHRWRDLPL